MFSHRSLIVLFLLAAPSPALAKGRPDAIAVARAYFQAMDRGDLDAAGALFATESSIFERGGVEGDWAHYRTHHLGPELDGISSFKTTLAEPEVQASRDRSLAFVAWPIEYRIELKDGRVIERAGTVTFVMARHGKAYKIRHLHWSSRAPRQ